ncbi:polysialyltransferase family glycosyltransferase [Paenibacillus sacheonensis]|uniref:Uncharacterized protein n=1 Tax=Paenibacillus sacheonensis TaxID=742054 RepID=A0A7X5C1W0_9BACL|nr:polysialyltransferase family glycosyltransferase [Paenibacillus sacheonensis]MBM7567980.1 L-rhamnose mutarotase [Paenibacillus sacheonensis]NBC73187.1 hypothetical protein [Paenibacillus sacheonensis]
MVIYSAITTYHTLCCILHKLKSNADKEAVLYLSNINYYATNLESGIKLSGIFKEVILFDDAYILKEASAPKLEDGIKRIKGAVEKSIEANMWDSEIYIAGDHFPFGLYCISNNIEYNFFEDGAGIYTRSELLFDSVKSSNERLHELMVHLKVNGKNENVQMKYLNKNAQIDALLIADQENVVDFNADAILTSLSHAAIEQLMIIFSAKEMNITDAPKALILTQHFANLNMMSLREQEHLYALLADYFIREGNEVIIKPHPSDIQGRYSQVISGSYIIPGYFPSELIPYCVKNKYAIGVTVSSTAIFNLDQSIDDKIVFSKKTEKEFIHMHRYYAVSRIVELLDSDETCIHTLGADDTQLFNFFKVNDAINNINIVSHNTISELELPERKVIIIDKVSNSERKQHETANEISRFLQSLTENDISIFINSEENNLFYDYGYEDIFNNMAHVIIQKELVNDAYKTDTEPENIFVYSKNKGFMNKLLNLNVERELKNNQTKIRISLVQPFDSSVEEKISKGILKSTIERLKLYATQDSVIFDDPTKFIDRLTSKSIKTTLQTLERRLLSYIE